MSFTQAELTALPYVISGPRFATYLRAKNGRTADALTLYVWNLRTSSAFLIPLQICEVSTRNAIVEVIEKVHGPTWPWSQGFIRSLPNKNPQRPHQYDPKANLAALARQHPTAGKIVAELNFAFWERIATAGQDHRLWLPYFMRIFPHADITKTVSMLRAELYDDLGKIRKFRNRIAHHEPIFSRNLQDDLIRIQKLVKMRNNDASVWLGKEEKVSLLLANKP